MPSVCEIRERETENIRPPWETGGDGIVSLLSMLEFSARDYVELTYAIGSMLGYSREINESTLGTLFSKKWGVLQADCERLGLLVTKHHADEVVVLPSKLDSQGLGI